MPPSGDEDEWPNPAGPSPPQPTAAGAQLGVHGRPRVKVHVQHTHASHAHGHATHVQQPPGHHQQQQPPHSSNPSPLLFAQAGLHGGAGHAQQSEPQPSVAHLHNHHHDFLHDSMQSTSSSSSSAASSSTIPLSGLPSMTSYLDDSHHASMTFATTSNRSTFHGAGSEYIPIDQGEQAHGTHEEGETWDHHQYHGAYSPDDTDMSDDGGGAPLVNYLEIANILTGDMSSPTESYLEAAAAEYNKEDGTFHSDRSASDSEFDADDGDDSSLSGHEPQYTPTSPHYAPPSPHHQTHFHHQYAGLPLPVTDYYIPHHIQADSDANSEPEVGVDADMDIDQIAEQVSMEENLIHHALQTFNSLHAFNVPPLQPPLENPYQTGLNLPDIPPPVPDNPHDAVHDAIPPFPSQNNNMTLRPFNQNLMLFLETWAQFGRPRSRAYGQSGHVSVPLGARRQLQEAPRTITVDDLQGDRCDMQGINWEDMGVTRREARERRLVTYTNYVNKAGSDKWHPQLPDLPITTRQDYFKFKRMDIRKNVHLAHFQLRNLLAAPSRSRVFYAGNCKVLELNPISGVHQVAMKSSDLGVHISTLAAGYGVLIAGGFSGEYCLKNLDSEYIGETPEVREGTITTHPSGITNHVQLHMPRTSSSPHAAFASNDHGFRVLDIATETFISTSMFKEPLNCTAMSPDGRLRVMVGDECDVFITTAQKERNTGDKPDIIHRLSGHRDFGFACDWAPDGYTVATGFQDKAVKIWDARRWKTASGAANPLCTIRCEVAGARGLRFSPLGSGKRVLVAAEEADYVNIIDAQTFKAKQTIDVFGEIGGIDFVDDGRELNVLCADQDRGGLIQLERCGIAAEMAHDDNAPVSILGSTSHHRYATLDRGENEYPLRGGTFDWPSPRMSRKEMEYQARRRRIAAATRMLTQF